MLMLNTYYYSKICVSIPCKQSHSLQRELSYLASLSCDPYPSTRLCCVYVYACHVTACDQSLDVCPNVMHATLLLACLLCCWRCFCDYTRYCLHACRRFRPASSTIYPRIQRFMWYIYMSRTRPATLHCIIGYGVVRARSLVDMGSCASKSCCDWCWRKALGATATAAARRGHQGAAAVHPWTPPEVPPGQRVTVRMRASEFRALAAVRSNDRGAGDGDVARLILDGCAAGRWAWSPAPEYVARRIGPTYSTS